MGTYSPIRSKSKSPVSVRVKKDGEGIFDQLLKEIPSADAKHLTERRKRIEKFIDQAVKYSLNSKFRIVKEVLSTPGGLYGNRRLDALSALRMLENIPLTESDGDIKMALCEAVFDLCVDAMNRNESTTPIADSFEVARAILGFLKHHIHDKEIFSVFKKVFGKDFNFNNGKPARDFMLQQIPIAPADLPF